MSLYKSIKPDLYGLKMFWRSEGNSRPTAKDKAFALGSKQGLLGGDDIGEMQDWF